MSDDAAFRPGYEPGAQTRRVRRPRQDPRQTSGRRIAAGSGVYEPGTMVAKRYTIRGAVRCVPELQVFKAVDQKHGTSVLLNVTFQSPERRRRLEREAEIAEIVRNLDPGPSSGFVVQQGWGSEAGLLFQVVEAIEAVGAFEAFSPAQGSLETRLNSFTELTRLVVELHRSQVFHCNLQPRSCRVAPDGRLFLGEFGLAVAGQGPHRVEHGRSLSFPGVPSYMAPECFLGEVVDERADVYSLGAMLFQILSDEVPYPGSLPAIIRAQTEVLHGARPPLPQGVEKSQNALARACVKATQPDPSLRPSSVAEILEELESTAGGRSRPSGMGRRAGGASERMTRPKVRPTGASERMPRSKVKPTARPSERMTRSEVKPTARPSERMLRSDVKPKGRASGRMTRPDVKSKGRASGRMTRPDVRSEGRASGRMTRPDVRPAARSSSTGPLSVEPDPTRVEDRLQTIQALLPSVNGIDLIRQGDVLSFSVTHWSRRVELRFTVHPSGRWGYLSRRAKCEPNETPGGRANLLYAVNAFNRVGLGARLRLAGDEVCFDRTVLLVRRATRECLDTAIEPLIKASYTGLEALKPIWEGSNWSEATRVLTPPPQGDDDVDLLAGIQGRMAEAELEVRREGETLRVERQGFEVSLSCLRGDLHVTNMAVASKSPRSSVKLKLGERVPACESLVTELDRLHAESVSTLAWDPKAGVVSRLTVNAPSCRGGDFKLLLDTVIQASALKDLESLTKRIKDPNHNEPTG